MNNSERNFILALFLGIIIIFLLIIKIILDNIRMNNIKNNKPISVNVSKENEESRAPLKSIPINIPTRGETNYIQIGILSNSQLDKVLPLYGKQTYQRSQRWNYYTTTNTYNIIKIPLNFQGDECMKERGCRELVDGDSIFIDEYSKDFIVKIYESKEYRYIPYI